MKTIRSFTMMAFGLLLCVSAQAYDRCEYVSAGLAGKYAVSLLKNDGTVMKVGNVKFRRTQDATIFKATNLAVIGDVLLPGAPKKIKLVSTDDECLFVGVGKIEDNTLGSIVEGEGMKTFSVQVEDETYESVGFQKI